MSSHQKDLVNFGSNFIFWPDERDWRFDVTDIWRTLVPEKARNHTDLLDLVFVEHVMNVHELWDIYEGSSAKWNKQALQDVLHRAAADYDNKEDSNSWAARVQTRIRNNQGCLDDMYNDDILMVSAFVREFDGKVSRGIFYPEVANAEISEWPFFSDRHYDEMCEALQLFTFTPGEKYIHGNKGMGHRIFNTIEGITRIDNSVMDSVRRSSTVLVRSRATKGKDPKQIQFTHGGIVDIGDADFIQNLMGANLSSSVEAARYFRFKIDSNNNISGASMSAPDGKPLTLGQTQMQVTREAKVQKNRIAHYYRQLDSLMREVVRKMLKSKEGYPGYELVKLWKERCIDRGVPKDFFQLDDANTGQNGLPEHMQVIVTRAGGSGSQVADQVEMQAMMPMLPTAGERGRQMILRDYVAAHRGFQYVDRYFPPEDQTQQPVGDDTIASIENNQLEKGEMVVVSPDNNHAVHAPRHLSRLQQIAKTFNEAETAARESGSQTASIDAEKYGQYSLEEVDVAFQTLGPHFVRHLLYLQQDPTRAAVAKSLANQWAILANYGDKIANNAQEHRSSQLRELQKGQQEMDKLDMEERVKNRQIEVDSNIKMRKLIADIQRGATRDQLQYLVQRQRVSFENELKRAETISKIARENAKSTEEEVTGRAQDELF